METDRIISSSVSLVAVVLLLEQRGGGRRPPKVGLLDYLYEESTGLARDLDKTTTQE